MSTFCRRSCEFQSTLPHGSDRERTQRHAAHGISIHAPSRERQGLLQLLAIGAGISIHAPSRERHYSAGSAVCCIYFNPRSLPGATGFGKSIPLPARISIHAPLRERRIIFFFLLPVQRISIHAPSRERPLGALTVGKIKSVISIHAPSRERHLEQPEILAKIKISIHAPSRERPSYGYTSSL